MQVSDRSDFIYPNWPAPENVKSISTTRRGGVSAGVYSSNNLAEHVGDEIEAVQHNRDRIQKLCNLPGSPNWLTQTHSNRVVHCGSDEQNCEADASYSNQIGLVAAVMTADCLPLLLCDKSGRQVAAVHAGWRGLLNNVIENSVACFQGSSRNIMAWLGPAIGKQAFEVGADVYEAFTKLHKDAGLFFKAIENNKFLADIYGLARLRLNLLGVSAIYGGEYCTFSDEKSFFSYRRDGVCGRMASLIWLDK